MMAKRLEDMKMTKAEITEKVKELISAPSSCAAIKAVAEDWLKAQGTAEEKAVGAKLVAELQRDVQPIDAVIGFFGSEAGKKALGEEMAAKILTHAEEVKAAGGKWCDCPACKAGRAILENKDVIL